jgi:hypothetical protein
LLLDALNVLGETLGEGVGLRQPLIPAVLDER